MYPLKYKGELIANSGRHPVKCAIMDLWFGLITYKYPLCCVLQYVSETLKSEPPSYKRHKEFNFNEEELKEYEYVPCDKCLKGKGL